MKILKNIILVIFLFSLPVMSMSPSRLYRAISSKKYAFKKYRKFNRKFYHSKRVNKKLSIKPFIAALGAYVTIKHFFDPSFAHSEEKSILCKKSIISEENFKKAMNDIANRNDNGKYLSERLSNKLYKFIGQSLSAKEWGDEVYKAYLEILKDADKQTQTLILLDNPIEFIVLATIWVAM